MLHHPSGDWRQLKAVPASVKPLLSKVMKSGKVCVELPPLRESRKVLREGMAGIDSTYLRLLNPHVYKVSISSSLRELKLGFIEKYLRDSR
jgi:nicotinate phosphoribosyltransferase